jgi:UvrD/REP helicase N-terminal domain
VLSLIPDVEMVVARIVCVFYHTLIFRFSGREPVAYTPTNEQQAILAHTVERHARVLAGPGTGKIATLVALMDHLLGGDEPPRIKLLTFTRAATAELVDLLAANGRGTLRTPFQRFKFPVREQ